MHLNHIQIKIYLWTNSSDIVAFLCTLVRFGQTLDRKLNFKDIEVQEMLKMNYVAGSQISQTEIILLSSA